MTCLDTMLDLLDHGCDGEPRWIALHAPDAESGARLIHLLSIEADRRGYVPLAAERVAHVLSTQADEMRHRVFAVLQTRRPGSPADGGPLMAVAAFNARPHVLVTIGIAARQDVTPAIVREARAVYAPAQPRNLPSWHKDSEKYLARAEQALALTRKGRHAPALRMLREAMGALLRRRDAGAGGRVGIMLGRVLLERGHADEAAAVFADVVTQLDGVDPGEAALARVWVAIARTDSGRLPEAESLLRATRMAATLAAPAHRAWADAALARCLLWQGRAADAAQVLESPLAFEATTPAVFAVPVLSTHARVRIALGHLFDAGQRARAAVERAERSNEPGLVATAGMTHLRVLAATGDLDLAAQHSAALLAHVRAHHLPLHGLRIRLIWAETLRQAGRDVEAARELRRCARLVKAAPELLKRHLHRLISRAPAPFPPGVAPGIHAAFAVELLRIAQEQEDDGAALQKVLTAACDRSRAGRIELQSSAAGALAAIASIGTGLPCRIGQRAFEAGISIGPESRDGVWQAATPVRCGHRVIGVVTARWPLGREAPAGAIDLLELTAAIVAPHADAVLAARDAAASASTTVPELIGQSDAIADVRRSIGRAATAPFPVLIEGESGSGKELVARAIHQLSARRDRRFCDVNCAALPEDLVESELFGHAKGAFTGALVERRGLFEEASGGTLFLDELPDLSLRSQAKLLRVIQQGEIRRVGESFGRRVDVRIVAATNRPMGGEVAGGRFRQDLLYRLDVLRITIPPLRDRPQDVPLLARHFWAAAAPRAGTRAELSHAVLAELSRYHWPGNVRELQNVMSALAVAAPARGVVRQALLPPAITGSVAIGTGRLADARRQFEKRFIEVALARAGGSRTRAAAQLGVTRQGLLKLMTRIGVAASDADDGSG